MPKTKPISENLIIPDPEEVVMNQMYYIRDQKVMLDEFISGNNLNKNKVIKNE